GEQRNYHADAADEPAEYDEQRADRRRDRDGVDDIRLHGRREAVEPTKGPLEQRVKPRQQHVHDAADVFLKRAPLLVTGGIWVGVSSGLGGARELILQLAQYDALRLRELIVLNVILDLLFLLGRETHADALQRRHALQRVV